MISLIVAMTYQRVIGQANQLPWHLPADLQYFKATTLHKPIVMGRKTYESIGKPLPQRNNVILTHDTAYQAPGCQVIHQPSEIFNLTSPGDEIMVIGGASIYQVYLPLVQRIYLTLIDAEIKGDTFFPVYDEAQWKQVSVETHLPDEKNVYPYQFVVLERIEKGLY